MRHLVKFVIIVLLASYGWRYSREFIRTSVGHITPASPIFLPVPAGFSIGEHYSPNENLETLDYQAIQKTRHTLEICMYSFTDFRLARAILDAARQGVEVRLHRDGEEYEQEQKRPGLYGSTTNLFRGQPLIHIRVKPLSLTELMHLKDFLADGALLRDGSANWSPAGEFRQDNQLRFSTDRTEIERFERNFQRLWNLPANIILQ